MSAPMSDERLAAIAKSTDYMDPRESDVIAELLAEVDRLREALQHIADGNISPSIRFARLVLDGATVKDAHRQEHKRMFGQ